MSPIRLLHVLEATVGGTRRHLLDLCLNLPRDRFRQHVVCSTLRDERFLEDVQAVGAAGIAVLDLPMHREISPLSDWRCLRQLRAAMAAWEPQIVHGHSSKGGFLARLAARSLRPRPRTVYNPHGFAFQMRTSALKRGLYVALERLAGRWTDVLVAGCDGQRQLALQRHVVPEERIAIIPNGIRMDEFRVAADQEACRRALGLPTEVTLMGTVAALTPQKGVAQLVRAAAAVHRERPRVHLAVAGHGPLLPQLRRLAESLQASEAIHFLGQRDDVPQFLAALDVFVLPSLWEGLPYALLEAGAAGVPVIATAIPGNVDVIEHGHSGLLVAPGDHLELTLALFRALDDPQMPRLAEALQERVERDYSLERMIAGHVRMYEGLVQA